LITLGINFDTNQKLFRRLRNKHLFVSRDLSESLEDSNASYIPHFRAGPVLFFGGFERCVAACGSATTIFQRGRVRFMALELRINQPTYSKAASRFEA
jgi:hypothetical protein